MDLRTIAFWTFWGPLYAAGALLSAVSAVCFVAFLVAVPVGFAILIF